MPEAKDVSAVLSLFQSVAPNATQIAALQAPEPQFMDAGQNFEAVICTECGTELDSQWWADCLELDCGPSGFKMNAYETPCCGNGIVLNDLAYHMPQAFGVFAIEAANPGIGELSEGFVETAEAALKTPLTVVYREA